MFAKRSLTCRGLVNYRSPRLTKMQLRPTCIGDDSLSFYMINGLLHQYRFLDVDGGIFVPYPPISMK